jgi:hypothetical protein
VSNDPFEKACPECWTRNRVRADYHEHAMTTGQIPTCGACGCDMFAYGPAFRVYFEAQQASPAALSANPWRPGDHLRVRRFVQGDGASFDHHGIYAGDGQVIEFDGPVSSGVIRETTIADFGRSGQPVERVDSERRFAPEEVVARARSRIGEQGYNLVLHNCEHFAHWARCGTGRSEQVQNHVLNAVVTPLYMAYTLWKGRPAEPSEG